MDSKFYLQTHQEPFRYYSGAEEKDGYCHVISTDNIDNAKVFRNYDSAWAFLTGELFAGTEYFTVVEIPIERKPDE